MLADTLFRGISDKYTYGSLKHSLSCAFHPQYKYANEYAKLYPIVFYLIYYFLCMDALGTKDYICEINHDQGWTSFEMCNGKSVLCSAGKIYDFLLNSFINGSYF